jgi:hypothetical protein
MTLAELLVATGITVTCAGLVAGSLQVAGEASRLQPERTEVQQRLRTGISALRDRLSVAGLGPEAGAGAGSLARRIAAVFPHRRGMPGAEPPLAAFPDRLTVYSVPPGGTYLPLADPMGSPGDPLVLAGGPECPPTTPTCRIAAGQVLLVFDASGTHDVFTAAAVSANAVQPDRSLSIAYGPAQGAAAVALEVTAIGYDAVSSQLRVWGPGGVGQPLLDQVVGFEIDYLADPLPPARPGPPPGTANCLVGADGALQLPTLPVDWGSLHRLPAARLGDGPECGTGAHRFDADLLRIRALRLTVRLQAGNPAVRGVDPVLFARPGRVRDLWRTVPDEEVTLQVSPPNLAVW